MKIRNLLTSLIVSTATVQATTVLTINDNTPTAGQPTGPMTTSVYNGTDTVTYTITGVDLTSEGGTASENIVFTVGVSSTDPGSTFASRGGSGGFSHISTAHANNFISEAGGETNFTWTANLSSTTYTAGAIEFDFTSVFVASFGANNGTGTTDSADVVSAAGTIGISGATTEVALAANAGPVVTLNNYGTEAFFGANGYNINVSATEAVPEPTSCLLLILASTGGFARRRRK